MKCTETRTDLLVSNRFGIRFVQRLLKLVFTDCCVFWIRPWTAGTLSSEGSCWGFFSPVKKQKGSCSGELLAWHYPWDPKKRNPIKWSPCDLIAVYFMTLREVLLKSFTENFPWKGSGEKGAGSPVGLFSIYCLCKQEGFLFYKQHHCLKIHGDPWRRKKIEPGCNISQHSAFTRTLRSQYTFTY